MPDDDIGLLQTLTAKQREVLDLLIQHKTSKEIARELGISPHTVDQRVQFAKERLGVNSRGEAAVEYRRLVQLCQSLAPQPLEGSEAGTYQESHSTSQAIPPNSDSSQNGEGLIPLTFLERGEPDNKVGEPSGNRVLPGFFESRHGTLMRLGAIVLMAVLLLFVALGGFAIFDSLSRGFAR